MTPPDDPKTEIDRHYAALERLVHEEISKAVASRYWRGQATPPVASEDDFDRNEMADDYAHQFPRLSREAILSNIDMKIYRLHLR